MRVLFLLEQRSNAGSIQAVAAYIRSGDRLGHTFAIYGLPHPDFPNLRWSKELDSFDFVILIFESNLQWMRPLLLLRLLASVPHQRRVILDADGMYNRLEVVKGDDNNIGNEEYWQEWRRYYRALAAHILQPTIFEPMETDVIPVSFYGYAQDQVRFRHQTEKPFDIMFLGHNWWRGQEMRENILPVLEKARKEIGEICFVGLWWDRPPSWAKELKIQQAFAADQECLRRLGVHVRGPVSYTEVIPTMSMGRINIMTQRPRLRRIGHLTSKYFEIFSADTIPLSVLDPEHAARVYGAAGRELVLWGDVTSRLLDVINRPDYYQMKVNEVRRHLAKHHNYDNRVCELVGVLSRL